MALSEVDRRQLTAVYPLEGERHSDRVRRFVRRTIGEFVPCSSKALPGPGAHWRLHRPANPFAHRLITLERPTKVRPCIIVYIDWIFPTYE